MYTIVHNMSYVFVNKFSFLIVWLLILSLEGSDAFACSLWAAIGDRSKDGGALIGMTWDAPQGLKGELRLVIPKKGSRYLGLFPRRSRNSNNVVTGINELGLVVSAASADSISFRKRLSGSGNLIKTILTSFATVDAFLTNKRLISQAQPALLIVADCAKIALVQIGTRGKYIVAVRENGLLYQTNHYTHQSLLKENELYIENSILRLNRLQYLLAVHPGPFSIEDFLAIADDKGNGPDNSIWRVGSLEKKEKTLARWVVYLSKNSPPELYFKILNPGVNELNYEIKLDRAFWTEGTE